VHLYHEIQIQSSASIKRHEKLFLYWLQLSCQRQMIIRFILLCRILASAHAMQSLENVKNAILKLASKKTFKHHKRYGQYHLLLLERLCRELCEIYSDADKEYVDALVRVHDYDKICSVSHDI
jgi:hypothetical protein